MQLCQFLLLILYTIFLFFFFIAYLHQVLLTYIKKMNKLLAIS